MIPRLHKKRIYLDWAASSPVSRRALKAHIDTLALVGNPSSPHQEGQEARAALETARTRIARLAEVKSDSVIFTGNATEANALLIMGRVGLLLEQGTLAGDIHVLYMPGSHSSVTGAVARLQEWGVVTEEIPLEGTVIDLARLRALIRPSTALVLVDAVCGETGVRYLARDVRRVLDERSSKALLHVDASQMPLTAPFELTRLGADTLALDSQKVGGVRGIGALIAPRRIQLKALYEGGGQERGLRSGTEAVALVAAFAEALEEAHEQRAAFEARAIKMRRELIGSVTALERVMVNEGRTQDPRILNLSFIGRDTDYLVALLDAAGFAVSTRSACETDAEGSRAVLALTGDSERARSTLRISWGPSTTPYEMRAFAKALVRAVNFLDTAGIL